MTPRHEDDKDLHDPLLSRLYRDLPEEAPSADTDARLRAAARRAVGAGPRRRGGFFGAHWQSLGASAAALLLGVTLTVQWRASAPGRLEEAIAVAPTAPLPAPTVVAPEPAPALQANTVSDMPVARAEARRKMKAEESARAATPRPEVTQAAPAATLEKEGSSDAAVAAPPPAPAPMTAPVQMRGLARADDEAAPVASARAEAKPQADVMGILSERARKSVASTAPERAMAKAGRAPVPAAASAAPAAAEAPAEAPVAAAAARPMDDDASYRQALAEGRFSDAQTLLPPATTPIRVLDQDLLRQWRRPGSAPACATMDRSWLGNQAPLCDRLRELAGGLALPPDWPSRLEAAGLAGGDFSYRRALLGSLAGQR